MSKSANRSLMANGPSLVLLCLLLGPFPGEISAQNSTNGTRPLPQLVVKIGHDPHDPANPHSNYFLVKNITRASFSKTERDGHKVQHGITLVSWRWDEVSTYFVITAFLIIAAVVKVLYHHSFIHQHVPESCVLIIFGTIFELGIYFTGVQEHVPAFTSDMFFFLLLPPIILESAYSLHDRVFFSNLGTVLLYAIVGTIMNVALIGPSLWLSGYLGAFGTELKIPMIECLCFSTLISAVDPVAVLAIFQELGVNKALYFLVFGESLLNDAVVIVLYNSMTVFAESAGIEFLDVLFGVMNFFTVSGGGLFIGFLLGGLTAIITRFTNDVRVVEPMVVIGFAYLSYVASELFHFSGIIGLIACGLMQAEYAKHNISDRSYVTIKYFTRNVSSIADVIIFFFLGNVLVRETHVWNTAFVLLSTVYCVAFRFVSVFSLTFLANYFFQRVRFINFEEQLVMAYGGLRGAIAFSLAIMLRRDTVKNADLFVTSTLFVILFTVFVLGSTTKTVVRLLRVKTEEKREPKMFIFISNKLMETCMEGVEELTGQKSSHYWFSRISQWNDRYLKRVLVEGGPEAANSYTEVYEKVKHSRPRSTFSPGQTQHHFGSIVQLNNNRSDPKNVRFSNGTAVGPEVVQIEARTDQRPRRPQGSPSHWVSVRNAFDFTSRMRHARGETDDVEDPPVVNYARRPSRKGSIFSIGRRDSEEEESQKARLALSSALSRTSFYHLPGSIYTDADAHADQRRRQTMVRYRSMDQGALSPSGTRSNQRDSINSDITSSAGVELKRRSQPAGTGSLPTRRPGGDGPGGRSLGDPNRGANGKAAPRK